MQLHLLGITYNDDEIPRVVQLRMMLNLWIDAAIGAIPLLGDLFDIGWKANMRNVALMEQAMIDPDGDSKQDVGQNGTDHGIPQSRPLPSNVQAQRPPGGERLTHNVGVQTFHNRKSQSLWAVRCTAWIGPITLNVAHESSTKSSAR